MESPIWYKTAAGGRTAYGKNMIRQNQNRRVNRKAIGPALKSINKTADQLLRSNKKCLIPETESMGHDAMNNCHVIGQGFLDLIANDKGQVLLWPISTRSIGRAAQTAINQGRFDTNPVTIYVDEYEPVLRGKNHKDCKFTFACHNHDDKVFALADSVVQFNPGNSETTFQLGLRTMATYTAWYRGHKRWIREEFPKDSYLQEVRANYPVLQPAFNELSEWWKEEIDAERDLEKQMKRWQSAYLQSAWHRAKTVTRTVTPQLRIAVTGIPASRGYPVAMTILPTANSECILIATVLEDETNVAWLTQRSRRKAAEQVATELAYRLNELHPTEWLPELAGLCAFLYISPEDYYNDKILTADDRSEIASAMSQKVSTIRI